MSKTDGRVRAKRLWFAALAASACAGLPFDHAHADLKRTTFAVMRNGEQIGTNTIDVERKGSQTTVDTITHVEVTLAFLTVYHFDQTETEQWSNQRLLSLHARTDDNGRIRQTIAGRTGDVLTVRCDDQDTKTPATLIPLDLWNPAVLTQTAVLDPQGGLVVPIRAIDHGEDDIVGHGHVTRAHHYTITTTFSQDVWYDRNGELVGVQLTGSDGSIIRYQLS